MQGRTSRAGSGPPVPALSVPLPACTTQQCLRPAPAPAGTLEQPVRLPPRRCCCLGSPPLLQTLPAERQRTDVLPDSLQPRHWVNVIVQSGVCSSILNGLCWWDGPGSGAGGISARTQSMKTSNKAFMFLDKYNIADFPCTHEEGGRTSKQNLAASANEALSVCLARHGCTSFLCLPLATLGPVSHTHQPHTDLTTPAAKWAQQAAKPQGALTMQPRHLQHLPAPHSST